VESQQLQKVLENNKTLFILCLHGSQIHPVSKILLPSAFCNRNDFFRTTNFLKLYSSSFDAFIYVSDQSAAFAYKVHLLPILCGVLCMLDVLHFIVSVA
jgi:hypothetical protein